MPETGKESLAQIPAELKQLPQWVVWKLEIRNSKKTKIPYNPKEPQKKALANDPSTWGSWEQTYHVLTQQNFSGIGFEFSPPYTGIDFDHVRNLQTGEIVPEILEEIQLLHSYTEVSPSGEGLHVIVRGHIPGSRRRAGPREMYSSGRFFTMTGARLDGTPSSINESQSALDQLYEKWFPEEPSLKTPCLRNSDARDEQNHLNDPEIIGLASAAKDGLKFSNLMKGDISGYHSQSEADLALVCILNFYCRGDIAQIDRIYRSSRLFRPKWDEKHGSDTYGTKTILKAISSSKCYYEPGKMNNRKKKAFQKSVDQEDVPKKKLPFFEKEGILYLSAISPDEKYQFVHFEGSLPVFNDTITDERGVTIYPQSLPIHSNSNTTVFIVGLPRTDLIQSAPLLTPLELYNKIYDHICRYVDAPKIDVEMFVYYLLYSWFYNKCQTAPYLRFLGDTGKGKSRMQKVVSGLCLYPITAGGASSFSGIMRFKEKWHGTLIIDESDIKGGIENPIIKYLNLGFERGQYYILTDKNDMSRQDIFDPFGPKVIAMRQPFQDNATEGRCLSFEPYETNRADIPSELPPSYYDHVNDLRAQIAVFVMHHWTDVKGEILMDCSGIEIEPRLKQMARPLSIVLQLFPDGKDRFVKYLKKRQADVKRLRSESWEGSLFNYALSLALGDEDLIDENDFTGYYKEGQLQAITARMIALSFKVSPKSVVRALSSIGFTIERTCIKMQRCDKSYKTISIRKLVVPSPTIWGEIVRRYFYSEIGEEAPPCPECLRGNQYFAGPQTQLIIEANKRNFDEPTSSSQSNEESSNSKSPDQKYMSGMSLVSSVENSL